MDREQQLAVVRRAYAKQIMGVMGIEDPRVEAAFGEVRREHFLGDGPWQISIAEGRPYRHQFRCRSTIGCA
jgi:protein-L-isoaspartate(D-aspartate) O-methyltransferase